MSLAPERSQTGLRIDGSFILVVQWQRDCLGFTEDLPEIMALLIDLVENWSRWANGE